MKRPGQEALVVLCALLASGCIGPTGDLGSLRPGLFVKASGRPDAPGFAVSKIESEARADSDKREKVEVTAPVTDARDPWVSALGRSFRLDDETEYQDLDKRPTAPFLPAAGDWVRLKLRDKGEGHRVRAMRRYRARDRFKVIGELYGVDLDRRTVEVGGLELALAKGVQIDLSGPDSADDPLALFLADDQKTVPLGLVVSDSLRLGGQVSGEYEYDDEFDLDGTNDRDRSKTSLGSRVDALLSLADDGSYALAEVSFGRRDRSRQNGATTYNEKLEVTRAFAALRFGEHFQLLLGRQDFDEGREWVYDEVLDGVRGVAMFDRVRFDLAYAEGRDVLAETNVEQDWGMALLKVGYAVRDDWYVTGYGLQRFDETPTDMEPRYFGVQSHAEPRFGLGHWLEFATVRGDAAGRAIRGHAYDLGLRYTLDVPGRPTFAIGHAFASGRSITDSKIGYRQSGFQDNTGKLGGVTSVRFYGELLDPELANLSVTTLSFAVRPIPFGSVQLMYHRYRQDVASPVLVDTSLRAAPNGLSTDLGHEIDLVLAYRVARRLTVEFVAGRFEPGDAFSGQTAANLIVLTTRYSF
ncbi:MAG TPA: hypothetical protein ENI87_15665 [bacterium]|nr:hypothetical protein [bacterium]